MTENLTSDFEVSTTGRMSIEQLAETTNQTFAGYFAPVNHTMLTYARFCRSYSIEI